MNELLAPRITRDSAPFWAALSEHRLTVQRCGGCGRLRFPPRAICPACHSWEVAWVGVSGRGRVLSWATTHQRFVDFLDPPYIVVLVELEEQADLALYGTLAGAGDALAVGAPVGASFDDVEGDLTLVSWSLT